MSRAARADLELELRTLRRRVIKLAALGMPTSRVLTRIGEVNMELALCAAPRKTVSERRVRNLGFATAQDPITGRQERTRCNFIDDSGNVVFGIPVHAGSTL